MKYAFLGTLLLSATAHGLDYEVQFENDQVHVSRLRVMPHEEIGSHRDELPKVVVALKGGIITRLESNGTTTEVNFPTGIAVFREADPPNDFHKAVNKSSEPIELITIQLKSK